MSRPPPITWDRLPLFADDNAIGEAVLGRDRRGEFHGLAALHEREGMPKITYDVLRRTSCRPHSCNTCA